MRTDDVCKGTFSLREAKTGKRRRLTLNPVLQRDLLSQAGKLYVFEGRNDWLKHRTRQAVYKDIVRASVALRLGKGITPHSARKVYAVERMTACGDLKRVQHLLNHSDEAVTMLYALADKM